MGRPDTALFADSPETLVVSEPAGLRGQVFSLNKGEVNIGRAEDNDVRLEDPYVSRHHAVVRRTASALMIEDAGSASGVLVNGVHATVPATLRPGDRIRLGEVELELVGPDDAPLSGQDTKLGPADASPAPRFDLQRQDAGVISNVAGNQYNEQALRIAPMRRRARWLLRVGFTVILLGFATYVVGFAAFAQRILHWMKSPNASAPLSVGGWIAAAAGSVAIVLGVLIVIISLVMRRGARKREERL